MDNLSKNKAAVKELMETAFNPSISFEEKKKVISKYVSSEQYIQHNPMAGDGIESFFGFISFCDQQYKTYSINIKRILAEGDLVVLHSHYTFGADDKRGQSVVDILRFEKDEIVEHWDVMQAIPEQSANENGMF